jgi:hypothetical protein
MLCKVCFGLLEEGHNFGGIIHLTPLYTTSPESVGRPGGDGGRRAIAAVDAKASRVR